MSGINLHGRIIVGSMSLNLMGVGTVHRAIVVDSHIAGVCVWGGGGQPPEMREVLKSEGAIRGMLIVQNEGL